MLQEATKIRKMNRICNILLFFAFLNLTSCYCQSSKNVLPFWQQKDFQKDNTPGISLDKWYVQNRLRPKKESILVAVIDTQIDSNHEDLKSQIWVNEKEIPNNNIDDDHNGYVDDVNGWSYVSNKKGKCVNWSNYENVRIVRKWQPIFLNKVESEISSNNLINFKTYKKALKTLDENIEYYQNWLNSCKYSVAMFKKVKDTLKHFFPKEDYTFSKLDSLHKIYKINDKTFRECRLDNDQDLGALIGFMKFKFEMNEKTFDAVLYKNRQIDSILNKSLNLNFNDRATLSDNPDILDKSYGSGNISSNTKVDQKIENHSTEVSGIIAANRKNNIGINGFSDNIKIMPLHISCSGDENDKDIANAIRYAVDNGAKIINMSFGKEFSVNKEWVFEALQYAQQHQVLVVHCSGNNGFNNDEEPYYPNDIAFDGSPEVCNNFINVGSTSQRMDSSFVSAFSNYGKKNVDLFAPGEEIYTTSPDNKYVTDSGTSLAGPMVSGTAALIWLYYPKLTVQEVKQIILDSGTSYDIEVIVPGTKDKKVKFAELSKSGKVLNVFNAMKMAGEISKKKK
jgi:cell wall-associated protease